MRIKYGKVFIFSKRTFRGVGSSYTMDYMSTEKTLYLFADCFMCLFINVLQIDKIKVFVRTARANQINLK